MLLVFLPAKEIEEDRGAERVPHEMDLAAEIWVSLLEEIVDPVGLLQNNRHDLFSIAALVKKNVKREIRDNGPSECDTFNGYVFETRVCIREEKGG